MSRHRSSAVNTGAVISNGGTNYDLEVLWYGQAEIRPENKSNEMDVERAYC